MMTVIIVCLTFIGIIDFATGHTHHSQPEADFQPPNSYSESSDLRTIAQGSAIQAQSAVAKQYSAGNQAAYVAKKTLADSASQGAITAQAVFTGKQVLIQNLEEQATEALHLLRGEANQLENAQIAAEEATTAAEKAANHLNVLTFAVHSAQSAVWHTQEAARESRAEVALQKDMVSRAKYRLREIEDQLDALRLEIAATEAYAEKAAISAQRAQDNAAEAKPYTSHELHKKSAIEKNS